MRSLKEILQSTSESLFPAELGRHPVALDSCDVDGDTPLHVLLWRQDFAAAKMLIAAGANPNAIGDMGETPLHLAVRLQAVELVELLLAAGAKADICSEFGDTPRSLAKAQKGPMARLFRERS